MTILTRPLTAVAVGGAILLIASVGSCTMRCEACYAGGLNNSTKWLSDPILWASYIAFWVGLAMVLVEPPEKPPTPRQCRVCRYELSGLPFNARCPECGIRGHDEPLGGE